MLSFKAREENITSKSILDVLTTQEWFIKFLAELYSFDTCYNVGKVIYYPLDFCMIHRKMNGDCFDDQSIDYLMNRFFKVTL